MLIKLIKHDLIATYRDLLPMYAGLLLLSIVGAISLNPEVELLIFVIMVSFVGLLIASTVILVQTILRLINRLYTNEGYLSHVLPASDIELFLAKIITAGIWMTTTFLSYLISVSVFIGLWYFLHQDLLIEYQVQINQIFAYLQEQNAVVLFARMVIISLPQYLVNIFYGISLILVAFSFVNTSYVKANKVFIGLMVYILINFMIENLNSNLLQDWFMTIDRMQVNINWMMYGLDFVYYLIAGLGLFSLTLWLNRNKLELN
jgi:hypothetical protein